MGAQREMMQMIKELRNEVQELRREVRQLRESGAAKDRPQVERRKESAKVPILGDVPYVGRLFRNEENKEITIEINKDPVQKPKDVKVELSKDPIKVDGFKIEFKQDPVEKIKDVEIEFKKDPVEKIKGAEIEFKDSPVEKLKDVEIEFKKLPIEKLDEAEIELEELSFNKLKKADLELQSSLQKALQQDVALRYATKATELAKVELEKALAANRKTPHAVSDADIVRMKLILERGLQEIDRAKREALEQLQKSKNEPQKQPAGASDVKDKPTEPK